MEGFAREHLDEKMQAEGPQMKIDEACDIFGVDQAIHMDDLHIFLHNQISQSDKNLILWYDYLNPTHTTGT